MGTFFLGVGRWVPGCIRGKRKGTVKKNGLGCVYSYFTPLGRYLFLTETTQTAFGILVKTLLRYPTFSLGGDR